MEPGAALAKPDPDDRRLHPLHAEPGPARLPGRGQLVDRHRGRQAAGHLDRDRRRLRRPHRVLPGADRRRRAGPRARPGRPLHRDALGDDARDAARPRAGAGRRDRRHPRRQDHRPEGPRDRRLRRLSRRRGADADAHRPDVERRLRHPEGRLPLRRGRDQHDADRRLPRRRAAGGDRAGRAGDRHVRRRDRDGPGRASRRKNFIPDEFPHQTVTGANYDSGEYHAALEKCLANAGYDELRAEQAARRERGDVMQLGLGLCSYVEWTGFGSELGTCEVEEDGTVTVTAGTSSHGQGHETAYAQLVAGTLGVPLADVKVIQSDTSQVARGMGTMGSRSLQVGGTAVQQRHRRGAREGAGGSPRTCSRPTPATSRSSPARAWASRARPPRAIPWAQLAAAAADPSRAPEGFDGGLAAENDFETPDATYPFGTHLAVVEVDTETGLAQLVRHITVDDAGRIAQPDAGRGPGPRRHRPGRRAGAVRGDRLRRGRQQRHRLARLLRDPERRATCRASRPSARRRRRRATRSAPRASARRARSARRRPSGTPSSTRCRRFGVRNIDMPATPQRVWQAISAAG